MRLKENFFETDELQILESMQDGYLYSNILLKMYLKSLKNDGRLFFNDYIPYNPQMIATITRHNVGTVEKALDIFKKLGFIDILDNGAIYMLDIQNFIGKTTTEADRQREYDRRIAAEKEESRNLEEILEKTLPKIEIELEKELKIETEKKKEPNKEKVKKENATYVADDLLNESILEFIKFRKGIKKPMTEKAISLLINKLDGMSSDNDEKIEILNQSILNGWQTIYPLKKENSSTGKKSIDWGSV